MTTAHDPATANDELAVRRLIARYADAVDTADVESVAEIWLHAADVSFIHPRGHERGWEAVRDNFFAKTMEDRFSKRKLTVRDVAVRVHGETAWAEFYWDFDATFREDGQPLATKGRETQVFRRAEDGWRIVHAHYSAMPVTGRREGF